MFVIIVNNINKFLWGGEILQEVLDTLYVCRFLVAFVTFIIFLIIFIISYRKKKVISKAFLSLCLVMLLTSIGIIVVKRISSDSYNCKVNETLVLSLKDALESCSDISILSNAPACFIIFERDSSEEAREMLSLYITEIPTEGTQDISAYSFRGVGGTKAESSKLYYYVSDDYILYCTPISHNKGNVVVPIFDFESYDVSARIVYKNYYISFDDTASRLSEIDINKRIEDLINYLNNSSE